MASVLTRPNTSNVVDISRRNPQDEYELVQRIGSGTYGDVYKVSREPLQYFQYTGGSIKMIVVVGLVSIPARSFMCQAPSI